MMPGAEESGADGRRSPHFVFAPGARGGGWVGGRRPPVLGLVLLHGARRRSVGSGLQAGSGDPSLPWSAEAAPDGAWAGAPGRPGAGLGRSRGTGSGGLRVRDGTGFAASNEPNHSGSVGAERPDSPGPKATETPAPIYFRFPGAPGAAGGPEAGHGPGATSTPAGRSAQSMGRASIVERGGARRASEPSNRRSTDEVHGAPAGAPDQPTGSGAGSAPPRDQGSARTPPSGGTAFLPTPEPLPWGAMPLPPQTAGSRIPEGRVESPAAVWGSLLRGTRRPLTSVQVGPGPSAGGQGRGTTGGTGKGSDEGIPVSGSRGGEGSGLVGPVLPLASSGPAEAPSDPSTAPGPFAPGPALSAAQAAERAVRADGPRARSRPSQASNGGRTGTQGRDGTGRPRAGVREPDRRGPGGKKPRPPREVVREVTQEEVVRALLSRMERMSREDRFRSGGIR